jgi:hypothetical protein
MASSAGRQEQKKENAKFEIERESEREREREKFEIRRNFFCQKELKQ